MKLRKKRDNPEHLDEGIKKKKYNIMRKLLFILVIGLLVGFTACQEGKVSKKNIQLDSLTEDTIEENDSTLYGFCGEGTSMNSLELISDEGDTLQLSLADDTIPNVKGGLQVGDRMAVLVRDLDVKNKYGSASLVINLTTLLGKWSALDKSFELQEGGVVVSNVTEPRPLVEWKILNGQLLLSSDTFDIFELGADSLYLENKTGIFAYKRVK